MRFPGFIGLAILGCALTLSGCSTGCIAVGGTDNNVQPTLGKQLLDLKVARDTGAVSDPEYQDAKARMINGEYRKK